VFSLVSAWLEEALRMFGRDCVDKLAGPGDREAAIRAPLDRLLTEAGRRVGVRAVFHDEVRDTERQVRPDYAVSIGGAIGGYVEVKAPGRTIDPASFTGHDRRQWERQQDLPNLLYTNGTRWRLFRDGSPLGSPVNLQGGGLAEAGSALHAPDDGFETLLTEFLQWKPTPITSVSALVRAVAPLTRLLRGEVLDQLALERRRVATGRRPRRTSRSSAWPVTGASCCSPTPPTRCSPTGTPRLSRSRFCWRAPRTSNSPGAACTPWATSSAPATR
jgi:hypothetical protein